MAKKYIDADRLRAEINETINEIVADALDPDAGIETVASAKYKKDALSDVLNLIDSLQQEQPEVDLEREIDTYFQGWMDSDDYCQALNAEGECVSTDEIKDIARYFGRLNARK